METIKAYAWDQGTPCTELEGCALGLRVATAQSANPIDAFTPKFASTATSLARTVELIAYLCMAIIIGGYSQGLPITSYFRDYPIQILGGVETILATGMIMLGAYSILFPFQLDFFVNWGSKLLLSSGSGPCMVFSLFSLAISTALSTPVMKRTLTSSPINLALQISVLASSAVIIAFRAGRQGNALQVFNPPSDLHNNSSRMTPAPHATFVIRGSEPTAALGPKD